MNKKNIECRALTFEMRAETGEKGKTITGRPIVYNSRTDLGPFDEVIQPGALDSTDLRDVVLTYNHGLDKIPIARSRRNNENSTMQLMPVPEGLDIRANADVENNAEARALVSAIERGDIDGMSFIFTVGEDKWDGLDTDHPTRTITKIAKVYEVSAVVFPAYESTSIDARDSRALESAKDALEKARETRAEKPLASGIELELAKAKAEFMSKLGG